MRSLVTLNSKCKVTIVKYANDIKLGSLIIIQSLNSLRKEIREDFVRKRIETISGSSFITMNTLFFIYKKTLIRNSKLKMAKN